MGKLVSIIIPCYNQGAFLAEAIESALNQDYPWKEVIVVNDGSTDSTHTVALSFGNKIVYIEQENKGISAAFNAGIAASRGDYIAFIGSDDLFNAGCISREVAYLANHADIDLVCSDVMVFNEKGDIGPKSRFTGKPKNPQNFRWETVDYYINSNTVMLRRSCLDDTGLFDETLRGGSEDWHLWVRISLQHNMAYIDEPLVRYRRHSDNITGNPERLDAWNRIATDHILRAEYFNDYPPHFRAQLYFRKFAMSWHVEPKKRALVFFLRAFVADPRQLVFGMKVIWRGTINTVRRRFMKTGKTPPF